MKEPKPYLLTIVSIFLIMSVALLATTAYLYFKKPSEPSVVYKINNISSNSIGSTKRDSLQKIYSATIRDLNESFAELSEKDTSTVQPKTGNIYSANGKNKDTSLAFDKLNKEINMILSDKSSNADLELAKNKINELQLMVDALKNKNNQIVKENEQLYNMLKQYTDTRKKNEAPLKTYEAPQSIIPKTSSNTAILKAEYVLLSAVTSTNFLDNETNQVDETDKLVASVMLKNYSSQNTVSEVMVVIRQPDGKVLQNSNWETGIFYSKDGKQIYSKKLRFNNSGGETKKLSFSLEAEKYLPGKYTVEVYYDGSVIGRAFKILS